MSLLSAAKVSPGRLDELLRELARMRLALVVRPDGTVVGSLPWPLVPGGVA